MLATIGRVLQPYPRLFRTMRFVYRTFDRTVQPWRSYREDKLIRDFNRLYYDGRHGEAESWERVQWLGVTTQKCPLDLWNYQDILFRTRPEVIVEAGVKSGGSTLFLAGVCDQIGHGKILGVDITLERVDAAVREHQRVELFEGSPTAEEIVTIIHERCHGRKTMVILDSDHRAEHVRKELESYAPLVSPGCYLICEDTNINGHPVYSGFGPGPFEALQEFLAENDGWTVDRSVSGCWSRSIPLAIFAAMVEAHLTGDYCSHG